MSIPQLASGIQKTTYGELILFFHHMNPRYLTGVIRLDSKCPNLLTRLPGLHAIGFET